MPIKTLSVGEVQSTNKQMADANTALMTLAVSGNQIVNLLTQLITGSNYNPQQHGSIGALGSLIAQTSFAQMLGVDNPMHRINAAQEISGLLYGYDNDPARKIHQLRTMQSLNDYNTYSEAQGKTNIYRTDRMTQASIARYLVANGDITQNDIGSLGQAGADATRNLEAGEKVVSIAQKVLKMGDDISAIMDTAKAIAGTNDFEQAAKTFTDYISGLVQSGMSLAERQKAISMTMRMTQNLRASGMSTTHAAAISRNAVGGASIGALEARRAGIQNYDTVAAANNAANLQLEAEQTTEGMSKLAATRTIMEATGLSDAQRKALLAQVKNSSPEQIAALMRQNGLSKSFDSMMTHARMDKNYLRDVTDKDTLDAMDDMADLVGRQYSDEQMEKFFKDNVAAVGASKDHLESAEKVKAAMKSGDWSSITAKDMDRARHYLTKEGRDVAIAQRNALKARQEKNLQKGMEAIAGMIGDGAQFDSSVTLGPAEDILKEQGLKGVKVLDATKMSDTEKIFSFMDTMGITDINEAMTVMEEQKKLIQKSGVKGDVTIQGKNGLVTMDKEGNFKSVTDEKSYKAAKDKKMKDAAENDPIGAILLAIKKLIEDFVNKTNSESGFILR